MKTKNHSVLVGVPLVCVLLLGMSQVSATGRDRFEYDATPKVVTPPAKPKPPASKPSGPSAQNPFQPMSLVMAVGEIREVFNAAHNKDLAFYVPEASQGTVQIVVEKKFLRKPVYFVRALRPGAVVGALVPKASLDRSGFRPKNLAEEGRVQDAMRRAPIFMTVR